MIGLHVQHDTVRAVDIVRKTKGFILNAIMEQPVDLPETVRMRPLSADNAGEYSRSLTNAFSEILSAKRFSGEKVSVAIDVRDAFIQTTPFNGDFSAENINGIIRWELSRFFPDISPAEFVTDTYNPGFNPSRDTSPRFIYTAVPRSLIQSIRDAILKFKLQLVSVNVDQFSIENLLRYTLEASPRQKLSAICLRRDNVIHCSLLWNHRFIRYREYGLDPENTVEKSLEEFISSASTATQNVDNRLFYMSPDNDLNETLLSDYGWRLDKIRAFDILEIKRKAQDNLPRSPRVREMFVPAISAALRDE